MMTPKEKRIVLNNAQTVMRELADLILEVDSKRRKLVGCDKEKGNDKQFGELSERVYDLMERLNAPIN